MLRGLGRNDRAHDLDTLARTVSEESGRDLDEALAAQLSALARDDIPARCPDAYDTGTPDTHCSSADTARASSTAASALEWADEIWEALVEESLLAEDGDSHLVLSRDPEHPCVLTAATPSAPVESGCGGRSGGRPGTGAGTERAVDFVQARGVDR